MGCLQAVGVEGAPVPFDDRIIHWSGKGNDVEAQGMVFKPGMSLQVMHRRRRDTLSFGVGNRVQRAAVTLTAAIADLDDDQAVAFKHDQIEFAGLAAIVTADLLQSLPTEPAAGDLFGTATSPQVRGSHLSAGS